MHRFVIKVAVLTAFLLSVASETGAQATLQKLLVSPNGRFLVTADGAAFFPILDTAWFLPKVSEADITQYMADRAAKGFNGVLIAAKYHTDILFGDQGPFDHDDTDSPNEIFWQHIDFLINEAAQFGIYVGLTIMWSEDWVGLVHGDANKAYRLGLWLGNRYASSSNLFWVISGEDPDTFGWSKAVDAAPRRAFANPIPATIS